LPNTVSVVPLEWKETAPGLLDEARGAGERLFVIAFDGERWTLDLFQEGMGRDDGDLSTARRGRASRGDTNFLPVLSPRSQELSKRAGRAAVRTEA